ncbi:MAG: ATP-binding protein [Pyrinomonadaceae bacterium]
MFDDLVGNDRVRSILQRLANESRVPNALLFAGPDGVGKRHFALAVAAAALCHSPKDGGPCGECLACHRSQIFEWPKADDKEAHKRVVFSEHPDLGMVIAYNRNILVDAVRDLEREANFRPYEAQARYFVIDDADKMNAAASNALLKTLEEPSATTHIILVTARPDALLRTIRSRCQTVRFAPVPADEIEKLLLRTHKYAQADARVIAAYAQGSVSRALGIDAENFRARRDAMMRVLYSAIASSDLPALLRIAEEVGDPKNKENFEDDLDILQSLIHDLWQIGVRHGAASIVHSDLSADMHDLAGRVSPAKLSQWLADIESLRAALDVNINRRIATDALFVGMAG